MIAYLHGTVRYLDEDCVVLDVGGVGYHVMLPGIEAKALRSRLLKDVDNLEVIGREAALWIHYHVAERQPCPQLIGFHERQDREFFRLLLDVKEIGPTTAARSMTIPVCDYAGAIERRDVRTLSALPGIGRRKADQIIATLKGKALNFALLPAPEIDEVPTAAPADFVADVEAVLVSLGHRPVEAVRMIEAARRRQPELKDAQALLEEIWKGEKLG